jgi:Glycosyl hydrolases family 35
VRRTHDAGLGAATDSQRTHTRRAFLKRGAAAGVGLSSLNWIPLSPAAAASAGQSLTLGAPNPLVDMPSAVFGGELQYFRMSASSVPARLQLCEQAAFSLIQTYVPWNVHEFIPGQLDFEGKTSPVLPDDHLDEYQDQTPEEELQSGGANGRAGIACNTDLVGFLTECKELGLAVILRPGPFISDEWRNGGLPDWFLDEASPDMYEYGPDGTPLTPGAPNGSYPAANVTGGQTLFYFPSPSYASDYYMSAARQWLVAFAQFAQPWLVTNGGPVVAIQVDDESCFYYRFGPFEVDYNPAMLARYTAETGADAPRAFPGTGGQVGALKPAFDWQAFKGRQVGQFLATLRDDLRESGIDVPINHEMELILAPPADMADDARAVLLNPELYPGGSGPEVMPLIELTAQAARSAQRNHLNVWSAEQDTDVMLSYLLLGEGIIGGIPFDYTDGVADSDVDDRRRLGGALKTAGGLLTHAKRAADVAVVWDNSLTRAPFNSTQYGFRTDVRRTIEQHLPALATLLLRAGLGFDLLDVEAAQPNDFDPAVYPTIFLPATDIIPRAIQLSLVAYVRRGGRLVCCPAPPALDEHLDPCTTLEDACYPERPQTLYPDDAQQIQVLGRPVTAWRGVQTYALSRKATPIATRNGQPCGYSRRLGRGTAVLLGTWLAADSAPGRAGAILESQQISSGSSNASIRAAARALASKRLGAEAAALVTDAPLQGGQPQELIVYDYGNERRGGDVISGGVLAYWDGENVVGMVEVNTTEGGQGASQFPYHPIESSHITAIKALAATTPQVTVSDSRVQARLLSAPSAGTATVMAANRWDTDANAVISVEVDGHRIRLPHTGSLKLPAGTAVLLPIGYELGQGVKIAGATAQLTGAALNAHDVTLELWSPAGGEVTVELPATPTSVAIDGKPIGTGRRADGTVRVRIPAGDHELALAWRQPGRRRRRPGH